MTAHKNPKCYAAGLGGCSSKISSEHFFSKAVLKLLYDEPGFEVGGFPWQRKPGAGPPSPESLASNILCKDHNEALSTVDAEALQLFHSFDGVHKHLTDERRSGHLEFEVAGEIFERWILKVLIGVVASGNAEKDNVRVPKSKPSLEWLQLLFGVESMPSACGVYALSQQHPFSVKGISFAPLSRDNKILGAILDIHGFRFLLAMVTPDVNRSGSLLENATYRPTYFEFSHDVRPCSARLRFRWQESISQQGLVFGFNPELVGAVHAPNK